MHSAATEFICSIDKSLGPRRYWMFFSFYMETGIFKKFGDIFCLITKERKVNPFRFLVVDGFSPMFYSFTL